VARNVVREQINLGRRAARLEGRHKKPLVIGVDIPTKDEIRRLLEAAEGYGRALLAVAVFTGLRASELRGLAWDAIDLKRGCLTVRQRADRWNTIGSPKTETSRREVPLPPYAVNVLREWRLACPKGPLGLVFPHTRGQVASLPNIHRRVLGALQVKTGIVSVADVRSASPELTEAQAIELAKMHPCYGLHAFRHAAASLYIEQGYSPKRIQALMGHSSIQVTFDIYGHLFPAPEDDQTAARNLQLRLLGDG
jgi:integrase